MFIAAYSQQPEVDTAQVPIHRWTDNYMRSIRTREYYPDLKRKEILTPATTCTNFEDITLGEISQTLKDKQCMIPLI